MTKKQKTEKTAMGSTEHCEHCNVTLRRRHRQKEDNQNERIGEITDTQRS